MEKNSTTRHVAIVEKCVMTEMAWRYIFSREDNRRYHIHLFKNVSMLRAAEIPFPWSTIIFSLCFCLIFPIISFIGLSLYRKSHIFVYFLLFHIF